MPLFPILFLPRLPRRIGPLACSYPCRLRPDHIQSDGYSVFKVHCEMAMFTDPMGPAKKSSHYVWTKGCPKRSSFEKFLLFFALLCRKPGGINEALHLLSHGKGLLWGCLGKIIWFLCASGTPSSSVAAIVHPSPREEHAMGWHTPKSKSEVSCGFAGSQVLCFSS